MPSSTTCIYTHILRNLADYFEHFGSLFWVNLKRITHNRCPTQPAHASIINLPRSTDFPLYGILRTRSSIVLVSCEFHRYIGMIKLCIRNLGFHIANNYAQFEPAVVHCSGTLSRVRLRSTSRDSSPENKLKSSMK